MLPENGEILLSVCMSMEYWARNTNGIRVGMFTLDLGITLHGEKSFAVFLLINTLMTARIVDIVSLYSLV